MTPAGNSKPGQNTGRSDPEEDSERGATGDSDKQEGRSGVQGAGTG
jgi:hypothetical protein